MLTDRKQLQRRRRGRPTWGLPFGSCCPFLLRLSFAWRLLLGGDLPLHALSLDRFGTIPQIRIPGIFICRDFLV
jgi:hypothetical protein